MTNSNAGEATIEESDPLRSISDAMRDAINTATEDATKAREKLREAGAGVGNSVSRFAYTSSYMVSYGIVYATVFVARSIPQDNPIVQGCLDGGRAAMDALNEAKSVPPVEGDA